MTAAWYDQELPETDGELYDLLQRLFGLGGWDESVSDQPYHVARMRQVSKLKGVRRARSLAVHELALAALYAHSLGVHVLTAQRLVRYIGDAQRAAAMAHKTAQIEQVEQRLAYALEAEQQIPRSPWVGRLIAAQNKEQVLTEWAQAREHDWSNA